MGLKLMQWKFGILSLGLSFVLYSAPLLDAQARQPRLVHLAIPVYLPLAIQAQIAGEVRLELAIGPDGAVKSWKTMSGHPLLLRAVTDSLPQAQFACEGCKQESYSYVVTYDFVLPEDRFASACAELHQTGKEPLMPPSTIDSSPDSSASLNSSPTHVTVRSGRAMCLAVDPATPRVRSARCLWLWKCALRLTPPASQTPKAEQGKD